MKIFFFLFLLLPMLALSQDQYTVVFLNKNPSAPKITKEETSSLMKAHLHTIERLWKEGKLLASGPFEGGGGIFILKTSSVTDAQAWVSQDSSVQAKRWNLEILPYRPRQGGICPVGESYEMTQYHLIRFDAIVTKSTATNFPEILKRHDDYLKEMGKAGAVVTEAVFGDRDGGIVVIRGDLQPEVMDGDPAVQEGLLQYQIKTLNIAKGTFCE